MNRDIKFRIWNDYDKKMIYWNELLKSNLANIFTIPSYNKWLMQYTGLHDKNGKEIYEGDIVKYENMTGKIMFFNGSFIMSNFEETEEWELGVINEELEIMGNIYDNPELLGGE